MIRRPSLLKSFLFIRRNRFKKKRKLNKMALELLLDKTTAIYLGLLFAYVFATMFIFGDVMAEFNDYFLIVEENAQKGFWLLIAALPIRYMFNAFREPGVLFSTAEYQLSLLPYKRESIWFLTLVERWIKKLFSYVFIGGIAALLTPIDTKIIFMFVSLILGFDIFMSVPQWKLFQQRLSVKIGLFLWMLIISGVGFLVNGERVGIAIVGAIVFINIILIPRLFWRINWSKVTEINDFTLWRMQLAGFASKTTFRRPKSYTIFQNSYKQKQPFQSTVQMYNRLWKMYVMKQHELIFRSLGSLFILLTVFIFVSKWLFFVGVAVTIYVYTSIASSFYFDRFSNDMIQILPWSLEDYKKGFLKLAHIGILLLFIPIIVFYILYPTWWIPLHVLLFWTSYIYLMYVKITKTNRMIKNQKYVSQLEERLGYLSVICIAISGIYPAVSMSSFLFVFLLYSKLIERRSPAQDQVSNEG